MKSGYYETFFRRNLDELKGKPLLSVVRDFKGNLGATNNPPKLF